MDKMQALEKRINTMCDCYKTIATISVLTIKIGDYDAVQSQNNELKKIFEEILELVEQNFPKDIAKKVKSLDVESLPESLKSIKTIKRYNDILSLKYTYLQKGSLEQDLIMNKLSVEFCPQEDVAYFNIINILYKHKKYAEIIKLCKFLGTFSKAVSIFEILSQVYQKTNNYGKALETVHAYLRKNENDTKTLKDLYKIYEKAIEETLQI